MERKESERLLRWYPTAWRHRYGDELLSMVEDTVGTGLPDRRLRWSLATAGLRERARHSWLVGPDVDRAQRTRGGATLVLWGWALLLPAGVSFAKLAEHWQVVVPSSKRTMPTLAMDAAQALAVAGGAAVLVATAMALPAFARRFRQGAWRPLLVTAIVVGGLSAAWLGLSVGGIIWAHHLSDAQRNGGSHAFTNIAYGWGSLTVLTVAAWTALAVRAERQLRADRRLLRVEVTAAMLVTAAITLVTAATVTWWAFMASNAPWFLQGFIAPPGQAPAGAADASPLNWRLVVTGSAMAAATVLSVSGMLRIARGGHRQSINPAR
jgi:hypothetical protein